MGFGSSIDNVVKGLEKKKKEFVRKIDEFEGKALSELQKQIDVLTDKAQRKAVNEVTIEEKLFLGRLYGVFVVGGVGTGYLEGAALLKRYLENTAESLEISSTIYEKSGVVLKEMERQKKLAALALAMGQKVFECAPSGPQDMLLAEQADKRLFFANNRFWLHSSTTLINENQFRTSWSVPDHYDFADFKGGSNWKLKSSFSEIPSLLSNAKLKVYDGLSHFLIQLDMAKEFDYDAHWQEEWRAPSK